jgi:hypothetical protein
VLDCPIWILIINVVAMDMLKSKLPPGGWFFEKRNTLWAICEISWARARELYKYLFSALHYCVMIWGMKLQCNLEFMGLNNFFTH